MLLHYLRLARKALFKNKYYTFINIFGLVFGMLSALVIAKYIGGSLAFDQFHTRKDHIYSVVQDESINGVPQKTSNSTYSGVGDLVNQFPGVVNTTRYGYHIESLIIADDKHGARTSFFENRIFAVDSGFFSIFTFPFLYGDPHSALSHINAIILTNKSSHRYFGEANPVGQSLVLRTPWGAEDTFTITGVIEDVPTKSQFNFDFLVTLAPLPEIDTWSTPDYSVFLLLNEKSSSTDIAQLLTSTLGDVPALRSTNRRVSVSLKSLGDVQLSNTEYILIAVGIFIVVMCWVNYVNQIIAQSYWRIKEIGVLRVMGATRTNLKAQFIIESGLLCVTSLILVVGIYVGIEPFVQSLTHGHLLPLFDDPTPINLIFLSIFTLGIVLAAAIPAMILFSSGFGTGLKTVYNSKIGSIGLRKALVVIQFSISTILMISIFVISNQLDFMNSEDKGINLEDILVVQQPIVRDTTFDAKRAALKLFKSKCAELPFVAGVSSSVTIPGEEYRQETYLTLADKDDKTLVHQNGVDENFLELYEAKFIAGHNFIPRARAKNNASIILNEAAAKGLGIYDFEKAIDTKVVDRESDETCDIIGIVKNFHQTSLKFPMRPMAFRFNDRRGHISLRVNKAAFNSEDRSQIASVKQAWEQVYPESSFDYFFLAQKYSEQNSEDQYFGKLFQFFTALSIVISCLGLFGLSLLISTKRQREIGVRKVFGASSRDILTIFLKGYTGSLLISALVGAPVAYWLMSLWLSNFAYRIDIGFGLMAVAMLSLTGIFLVTVAYHTIRSSVVDPVKVLRD